MEFSAPLQTGRLIRRYKRFLADITLDTGEEITAHCANPGSMMGIAIEGAKVWVSKSTNKARKFPYSWEMVEVDETLVPINTSNPNKIGAEAIAAGMVPALNDYQSIQREVKYGENSRIDLLLTEGSDTKPCYVEIKNVHLMRSPGLAEFPDSVTARGAKHLGELARMAETGARAVMLFIVQRMDCQEFSVAADIDQKYAAAFQAALDAGVETMCYDCAITTTHVELRKELPIRPIALL